jgi:hypothetical protein
MINEVNNVNLIKIFVVELTRVNHVFRGIIVRIIDERTMVNGVRRNHSFAVKHDIYLAG